MICPTRVKRTLETRLPTFHPSLTDSARGNRNIFRKGDKGFPQKFCLCHEWDGPPLIKWDVYLWINIQRILDVKSWSTFHWSKDRDHFLVASLYFIFIISKVGRRENERSRVDGVWHDSSGSLYLLHLPNMSLLSITLCWALLLTHASEVEALTQSPSAHARTHTHTHTHTHSHRAVFWHKGHANNAPDICPSEKITWLFRGCSSCFLLSFP